MRPILLLPTLIAATYGVSQAAPARKIVPRGAVSFTSKAQGFAIWFPTKPIQSSSVSPLKPTDSLTFKSQSQSINYVVLISKLSAGERSNPTAALNNLQKGMVDSVNGKLQKVARVQLNGFPGREITMSLADGTVIFRGRNYITPRGSYSVGAGGYKAPMQKQNAQINRVFDSFRILPQ